jgi:hypothetical protein
MATVAETHKPGVARVDFLVDENGQRVDVPDNSKLEITEEAERSVGSTAPSNWWRASLIALGIVALILLLMQIFGGNPGTDVQPGTPVAAPQEPAPQG